MKVAAEVLMLAGETGKVSIIHNGVITALTNFRCSQAGHLLKRAIDVFTEIEGFDTSNLISACERMLVYCHELA